MTRKKFTVAATLIVVVFGLLWLRSHPQTADSARSESTNRGGALVATARAEPRSFNAFIITDATSNVVRGLLHAKLVRVNHQTDELEPMLAKSWSVSPDGLTYTLKLRDGVAFSDGSPFTSSDVLFSAEAVYDRQTGSPLADAMKVSGDPLAFSAPDSATVVVRYPKPFGPGLRMLDSLPILPRHRLEAALKAGTLRSAWGLKTTPGEMAGLGPFVVSSYEPGQRMVFVRNPHYWQRDASGVELPYLDRLVLEIVPSQDAEILQLESGQVDLISSEIRPDDYVALKREAETGRIQLVDLGVGLDPNFLWLNLQPSKQRDARHGWLQHVDLRRAISHAVDRDAFANTVYLGAAVPVHGPVTPANKRWYSPAVPTYAYDPARARELLGGLGLHDKNGDGSVEDSSGKPAQFTILTQKGNTPRERGAAVLQEDLRRVGLTVDVVPLEVGALVERFSKGDYDAVYFGVLASDTDPAVNLDFWLSSGTFHPWHPQQSEPTTEWERQIDELMVRQVAATDAAERKRLFDEVQRIFGEQLPAIYFAAPRIYVAMGPKVGHAMPVIPRPQILWNAEALTMAAPRVARGL